MTPQARAATVARVGANDPQVTEVDWGLCADQVTDAEVQALAAKLAGNTHVLEIQLDHAGELTDAGARLGRMRRDGVEVGPMRSYPGGYAVSRAIGDFDAPHVVCTPEVKRVSYF